MKKYYAYSQVKQDIANLNRYKSEAAKKRAIKTSLDNNFVSEFTSLLVVLPQADTNSRSSGSLDPNVYLTGSGGMNQMSHSLVVDSKLQFTDDERSDLPEDPCRITLYSGPQHTGDSLSLSSSVPDLGAWWDFPEVLSLNISGDCSWTVYGGEAKSTNVRLQVFVQEKTSAEKRERSSRAENR